MEDNAETLIGIEATTDTPRPWVREAIVYWSALYALAWTGSLWVALDADSPHPLCWELGLGVLGCLAIPLFVGGKERFLVEAGAGRLTRRGATWIAASDVEACSTARLDDGRVSIALALRGHDAFFMTVDSDADAEALLRSLGIAGAGTGEELALPFRNERTSPHRAELAMTTGLSATLLALASALFGPRQLSLELAIALAFAGLGLLLWRVRRRSSRRTPHPGVSIVLARHEVRTPSADARYAEIHGIRYDDSVLEIDLRERAPVRLVKSESASESTTTFLDESDSRHLIAHLLTAAHRAWGPARDRSEAPPLLAPREPTSWLAALDFAAERLDAKASYREVPVEPDVVEAVLRDADQSPAVRAAAARVLVRAGRARAPIEAVLAALHGEGTTKNALIVAGLEAHDADPARALDALLLSGA